MLKLRFRAIFLGMETAIHDDEIQTLVDELANLAWDAVAYLNDHPDEMDWTEHLMGVFERRLEAAIVGLARPAGNS